MGSAIAYTTFTFVSVQLLLISFYFYLWLKGRENRLRLYRDPDLMEQEIERVIPLGSSVEQAKRMMERRGFSCHYADDSSFYRDRSSPESGKKSGESKRYTEISALHCEFSRLFTRWQILLAHEDRKVTIIAVSMHFSLVT